MNKEHQLWTRDYIIFCLSSLVMLFAFYSLVSTLPIYLDEHLKATKSQIGWILSSYAFAAVLLRPFCGYALDAWGRKGVFMVGFFIFSLLFGLYSIPSMQRFQGAVVLGFSLPLLMVAAVRFVHGLSWAIVSSGSQTISVDIVPVSRRGEGIAYYGLSASLSMAVGPAMGLWLIHFFGTNHLFVTTMVLSLLSFGAVCFMRFPVYRPQRAKINLHMIVERTSIPLSLVCATFCFSNASMMTYMPIYCKEIPGSNSGVFFFIFALGMAGTRLFSGKIFDRTGPKIPMGIGFPLVITGFVLMGLAHQMRFFYSAAVLIGIGNGMIFPSFVACINNMVKPTRRGAANATFSSAIDVGIGLGIIFFGYLAELMGLRFIYFISALLYILAYLSYLLVAERHYFRHKLKAEETALTPSTTVPPSKEN